jgi:hypothetical protein
MIYNHILDGVLPMKTPQEVWKGAQDHSHAFMQVLLETCSSLVLEYWISQLEHVCFLIFFKFLFLVLG